MAHKALLAIVIVLIAAPGKISAQEDSGTTTSSSSGGVSNFRFGIHASPNISFISTKDEALSNPANVKFGFGLLAQFNFAENYAISSGINFTNRGGDLSVSNDSSGSYSAQFLQIPIRLKMSTREFGYSTFFASFGGSIDMRLTEEASFVPELTNRQDSYVSFFNAMFCIGAGMEYSLGGNTSLVGGIYYNRSLINNLVINDNTPIVDDQFVYRLDYINVQVGILF